MGLSLAVEAESNEFQGLNLTHDSRLDWSHCIDFLHHVHGRNFHLLMVKMSFMISWAGLLDDEFEY